MIGTSFLKDIHDGFMHQALKINPSLNSTKVLEVGLSELSGYLVMSSIESRF